MKKSMLLSGLLCMVMGLQDALASRPWPDEVDHLLRANVPSHKKEKWDLFSALGLELPLATQVGWMWAFGMTPVERARAILTAFHPDMNGKRTPLLTFPYTPLGKVAMEQTYAPLVQFVRNNPLQNKEKGIVSALDHVWCAFPELCTVDLLGDTFFPKTYAFLENPLVEAPLFNLMRTLQEKYPTFFNPGLVGVLLDQMKTPEACADFLSYVEGAPLQGEGSSSSSFGLSYDVLQQKRSRKAMFDFWANVKALHAVYPHDAGHETYKRLWDKGGDVSGLVASIGTLQTRHPVVLSSHRLAFMAQFPKSDVTQGLARLEARGAALTDAQVRTLTGHEVFMGAPTQAANDLMHFMDAAPGLSLDEALLIYAHKKRWEENEARAFMAEVTRLRAHVSECYLDKDILQTLTPLMLMGPIYDTFFKWRRPQDPDLTRKALMSLKEGERLTLKGMECHLTILHGKSVTSVSQSVALLRDLGVTSFASPSFHLNTLVSLPEEVHASHVLRTLAFEMFPSGMTPQEKAQELVTLVTHPVIGPALKAHDTAPNFLAHMKRIMQPYQSARLEVFADLPPQEIEEAVDATLAWWEGSSPQGSFTQTSSMKSIKAFPPGTRFLHARALRQGMKAHGFEGYQDFALDLASQGAPVRDLSQTWDGVWRDAHALEGLWAKTLPFESAVLLSYLGADARRTFVAHMEALVPPSLDGREVFCTSFDNLLNEKHLTPATVEGYAATMAGLIPFKDALTTGVEFARAVKATRGLEASKRALFFQTMLRLKDQKNFAALMEKIAPLPSTSWDTVVNRLLSDKKSKPQAFLTALGTLWQEVQNPPKQQHARTLWIQKGPMLVSSSRDVAPASHTQEGLEKTFMTRLSTLK